LKYEKKIPEEKLHLGCGDVIVDGWLNVDVTNSDYNWDIGCGKLPFPSNSFEVVASQQVVEHLELHRELIPLLREIKRVSKYGAEIWVACPDMERVCRSYLEHKGRDLIEDRKTRLPNFQIEDECPPQQIINNLFHQGGEHRNLFDFELLKYALNRGGLDECVKVGEDDFDSRFTNFPERGDDYVSLYVKSVAN
jgi:predicted SAM-dependent methyltransferase